MKLFIRGTRVLVNKKVPGVVRGYAVLTPRYQEEPEVFYVVDLPGQYLEDKSLYITITVAHPDNITEDKS